MTKVLAAIDNSSAARPVLATAACLARLYHAEPEALHVREDGTRTVEAAAEAAGVPLRTIADDGPARLIEEAERPEVRAIVLGARGAHTGRLPAGHVALELIVSLSKPLVVVPPRVRVPVELRRVLVPLDGSVATTAALASTVALACGSGLEVVALHVHDHERLPRFDDQPQHETEAWTQEFLTRYCPHAGEVSLELRVGVPGRHVLDVAAEVGADLIALGWSQDLAPGRAAVVREVLERSPVPVLLLPVPGSS